MKNFMRYIATSLFVILSLIHFGISESFADSFKFDPNTPRRYYQGCSAMANIYLEFCSELNDRQFIDCLLTVEKDLSICKNSPQQQGSNRFFGLLVYALTHRKCPDNVYGNLSPTCGATAGSPGDPDLIGD